MKFPQKTAAITSLSEMETELNETQNEADAFLSDISEMGSEDELDFSGAELDEGEKEEVEKIKTPEDAKKVLNTCKEDLQKVIDSLDGLTGQVSEEITEAKFKRYNEKVASSLIDLAASTDKAIKDAKDAMKHWAFLKKAKKANKTKTSTTAVASPDSIDQVFATIEKSMSFAEKIAKSLGYVKADKVVEGTAVAPTGAEFSGDKFPGGKNPAEVENRAWDAGAGKFHRDVAWENSRTNPAVDHRLDTTQYQRNDAPYVNASFKFNKANKFLSFWEIVDTKSGKKVTADFANVPASIGVKNADSFKLFASKQYGERIIDTIVSGGIDSVAKSLGGTVSALDKNTLKVVAADKGSLRSYYTDAFGDAGYSGELVAGKDNSMSQGYTPKDNSVKSKSVETKDGTGKISNKPEDEDHQLLLAKSRQAIMLARKIASRGGLPFVKLAIMKKAEELMELDDASFTARDQALDDIPVVNEAALKNAHIPDTEVGIVGNTKEGVRDQSATVKTEDLNSGVSGDAKINKSATLVPQMLSAGPEAIKFTFNSVKKRLEEKGIQPGQLRIAKKSR